MTTIRTDAAAVCATRRATDVRCQLAYGKSVNRMIMKSPLIELTADDIDFGPLSQPVPASVLRALQIPTNLSRQSIPLRNAMRPNRATPSGLRCTTPTVCDSITSADVGWSSRTGCGGLIGAGACTSWRWTSLVCVSTKPLDTTDRTSRDFALKFALAAESRRGIENLLALTRNIAPVADAGDSWDVDPWLLGVTNGVMDLRTGILRPGRHDDWITLRAGVAFERNARCPRWQRFLSEIFAGDQAVISFVQKAAGYSLTGDTAEQCLFLCHGTGANGKTLSKRWSTCSATTVQHAFSSIALHRERSVYPTISRRSRAAASSRRGSERRYAVE